MGAVFLAIGAFIFFISRRKRRKLEEAVAQEMKPLPVSRIPGPSANARKRTPQLAPLRWSPEPSYSGSGSQRLFVTVRIDSSEAILRSLSV